MGEETNSPAEVTCRDGKIYICVDMTEHGLVIGIFDGYLTLENNESKESYYVTLKEDSI